MRKFDYSFLNIGLLSANLVNLTSNIATLKTMAGAQGRIYKDSYGVGSCRKGAGYNKKCLHTVNSQNSLFIRSE